MTRLAAHVEDRMIELLADRALGVLTAAEGDELLQLLRKHRELDTDVLDIAAATIDLAWEEGPFAPLPSALVERVALAMRAEIERTVVDPPSAVGRLLAQKRAEVELRRKESPEPPRVATGAKAPAATRVKEEASWTFASAGWLAAALCFLVVVLVWKNTHPPEVPMANQRAQVMARPDALQVVLASAKDPAAAHASGDVVWSAAEQRGFMRFRGLLANDRHAWEYQLWIFDGTQDDRFPIDGGVFDVDQDTGDVLVPIQAKIRVNEATRFVVTAEKPGGVVVSNRERVVMVGKI